MENTLGNNLVTNPAPTVNVMWQGKVEIDQ